MSSDPANETQVSKAITVSVFVFVCLFVYFFKKRQIETIINDRGGPTIYRVKKKTFCSNNRALMMQAFMHLDSTECF